MTTKKRSKGVRTTKVHQAIPVEKRNRSKKVGPIQKTSENKVLVGGKSRELLPLKESIFERTKSESKIKIPEYLAKVSFDSNDDARGFNLVSVIRMGIDYKSFRIVADKTPLNDKDWATVLDTTTRTLDRYKKENKVLSSKQTESIIEIQQLINYGEEVFGDIDNFNTWLMMENVALGGVIPKDLLDTSVGLDMVKDILGRIEHGILA